MSLPGINVHTRSSDSSTNSSLQKGPVKTASIFSWQTMPNDKVKLKVMRLPSSEGLELPSYQTSGSSGMDLRAAIYDQIIIPPMGRALIPTGLTVSIPPEFEGQVRPRSGLALRYGITVLNTPGTVDSDYRGELAVILVNLSDSPYTVKRGDRIAQLVVAKIAHAQIEVVNKIDTSNRGEGGFGHTGL